MLFKSSKETLSMSVQDGKSGERLNIGHLIRDLSDDGNQIRKPGTDRKLFVQEEDTVSVDSKLLLSISS
jgi:hypothetical protein